MGLPRVLLADDLPEMLENVARQLRGRFDIVGLAANGQQAIEAVAALDPDLLVLDISMPIVNGIQAATRIRDSRCRTKMIFLTVLDDPDYIDAAFAAGALAYVLKSRLATDLIPAIEAVLHGQEYALPVRTR